VTQPGLADAESQALLRVGPFAAFSNTGYPFFWSSSVIASMGVSMQSAIGQWQVYTITESALQLGLVGLMNVLPLILFGVFGGAAADMVDRRKLIVISQVMRIGVVGSLGLLTMSGHIQVWQIYVGGLTASLAAAFDQPARQAMIYSLVRREHFMNAVTWHNVQRDVSNLVGPGLAGIIMKFVGIDTAYFINCVFFVPLIFAMTQVAVGAPGQRKGRAFDMLADGFRFLKQTPVILTSLSLDFVLSFFGAYRGLLALYARDILKTGPDGFGALSSGVALGGMVGSAFVLSLGESKRKGQIQMAAMLVYAFATMAFGVSSVFLLSLGLTAILGFCDTVAGTMRRSIIQLSTPEPMQGRVGAVQAIVGSGGPALGATQAGATATLIGAPMTLVIGGCVCAVTAALTAARNRGFRTA
jgi:MFS family permease